MYRSKGNNYWINVEWGNYAFEHSGTQHMVAVFYNQINRILFMPEYNSLIAPFPPPHDITDKLWRKRLTSDQSRMLEFNRHQLIFIGSESRQGELLNLEASDRENGGSLRNDKLVQFICPDTYNRFVRQLRSTHKLVAEKLKPSFPFPTREDVLDIEVYRYVDTFLRENCLRLPSGFKESLELECNDHRAVTK